MSIAVVHDYLTQRGGAERVVISMLRAFPGAPVHTSLYDSDRTYPTFGAFDVRTLPLDRVGVLRRHHRWALPMLAPAFSRYEVDAEVVLCSSSGWAHGVRTTGRKIVYCYSPARWLYDGAHYLGERRPIVSRAFRLLRPPLLRWDQRSAATADRYLTLSRAVERRIRAAYGIDAEVVAPPPTLDPTGPQRKVAGIEPGFLLCTSRLLPYKNISVIVDAFSRLPTQQLVVAGAGPERGRLERMAGGNVLFVGSVHDEQLRWLYAACAGLVAASHEDFGLTPLEAASFGKASAVLRWGGFLDTVLEDDTGVFFDEPSPGAIAAAVRRLLAHSWSSEKLQAHAELFSETRFIRRLQEIVVEEAAAGRNAF